MTRPYLERRWVQVTFVVLFGVVVLAAYIALTDDSVQRDQDGVPSRVEWHWPGKDAIPPTALALIGATSFGAAWWIRRNPADPEPDYEPPMYDDHLEDDVDLDDDLDDEPGAHPLTSFAQIRGLEDHPEITNALDAEIGGSPRRPRVTAIGYGRTPSPWGGAGVPGQRDPLVPEPRRIRVTSTPHTRASSAASRVRRIYARPRPSLARLR